MKRDGTILPSAVLANDKTYADYCRMRFARAMLSNARIMRACLEVHYKEFRQQRSPAFQKSRASRAFSSGLRLCWIRELILHAHQGENENVLVIGWLARSMHKPHNMALAYFVP